MCHYIIIKIIIICHLDLEEGAEPPERGLRMQGEVLVGAL